MKKQPSEKALSLAKGRWAIIFARLAPELGEAMEAARTGRRSNRHVACPVHGGSDGFRLFSDWEDTGGGICNSCDDRTANGLQVLMWLKGWTYTETLKILLDLLEDKGVAALPARRMDPQAKAKAEAEQREDSRRKANNIRRMWQEAVPLVHPAAELGRVYFAHRGLAVYTAPSVVRFHPALFYRDDQVTAKLPALLFCVRDTFGRPTTIHRIYLDGSGRKAQVSKPKRLAPYPEYYRELSGGAIRLFEPGPELGIAEGIETALAVREATGIPVWAAVSAQLMESVRIPGRVRRVTVWLDKDRNGRGRSAAKALCERVWRAGRQAGGYMPPLEIDPNQSSVDWLDVYNRVGVSGFPDRYNRKGVAHG